MSRILSLDYGSKRTGIAVTDMLRIVPNGLTTIDTRMLLKFLEDYIKSEDVGMLVVGMPSHLDGNKTQLSGEIESFLVKFEEKFPHIKTFKQAEWFTSKQATQLILQSGIGKMKRRDKGLVDKISAVIILEEFMQSKAYTDSTSGNL